MNVIWLVVAVCVTPFSTDVAVTVTTSEPVVPVGAENWITPSWLSVDTLTLLIVTGLFGSGKPVVEFVVTGTFMMSERILLPEMSWPMIV